MFVPISDSLIESMDRSDNCTRGQERKIISFHLTSLLVGWVHKSQCLFAPPPPAFWNSVKWRFMDKTVYLKFEKRSKKSRIRATLNLLTTTEKKKKKCHVSRVTFQVSHITYHLSPVTYHLSLKPTSMDPHPAYSLTNHSRLVCKDPKPKNIQK